MPRYLRARAEDFPASAGYLAPDPALAQSWRRRLDAYAPSQKVGISWRGGTPKTRGGLRSLSLEGLAPLLDAAGSAFVVLQRDLKAEERAWLAKRNNVIIPDAFSDLDDLAALVSELDLTITVPNTNLHLAGALGRPVWGLLTKSPEWRYLWQGERMPWYPSARLIRQSQARDWPGVIQEVRAYLEQRRVNDGSL